MGQQRTLLDIWIKCRLAGIDVNSENSRQWLCVCWHEIQIASRFMCCRVKKSFSKTISRCAFNPQQAFVKMREPILEWRGFLFSMFKQLPLVPFQSIATNDDRDYVWKVLAEAKMASLERKRHYSLAGPDGKIVIYCRERFCLQGDPVETAIWTSDGSVNVSSFFGIMSIPHWNAILDMAGDLVLVMMRTAKIAKANDFEHVFICAHDCAWVCVSVWSSTCKCDSFTHLQSNFLGHVRSYPWLLLDRAFPVCCAACTAFIVSPQWVRSSRGALAAPSSWRGMQRWTGWWWQQGEGTGGCSLFSRLYSHLLPQGTTQQLDLN